MKKGNLLNAELSRVIATMGHTDSLAVGDAGLPIPHDVLRIDLAVTQGVPDFLTVLTAILSELKVERVIMALEMRDASASLHQKIIELLHQIEKKDQCKIAIDYVSHDVFKEKTTVCKTVARTGEFTPYANIILVSGVVF